MLKSVGYSSLIEKYGVQKYLRNHQQTWIAPRSLVRESGLYHHIQRHFTSQYDPEQSLGGQLEFAIKYEGLNPHLLLELFKKIPRNEIVDYISSKQTGKYTLNNQVVKVSETNPVKLRGTEHTGRSLREAKPTF